MNNRKCHLTFRKELAYVLLSFIVTSGMKGGEINEEKNGDIRIGGNDAFRCDLCLCSRAGLWSWT